MGEQRTSAKYWEGILYPENMIPNWKNEIEDIIQIQFSYCVHDKDLLRDKEGDRKIHVHLLLAFKNTTTMNYARTVCNMLSLPGKSCCPRVKQVIDIEKAWKYLIHDTDSAKKAGKHLYNPSERFDGNNFDIGVLAVKSLEEKNIMCKELCDLIYKEGFCNFMEFYVYVVSNLGNEYFEVLRVNSGFLERMIKGNFHLKNKS